jgi:hypothetical protein
MYMPIVPLRYVRPILIVIGAPIKYIRLFTFSNSLFMSTRTSGPTLPSLTGKVGKVGDGSTNHSDAAQPI